jgi:hypothetical protein
MIFLDEVPVFVMLSLRNISAERFSDVSYAEMLRKLSMTRVLMPSRDKSENSCGTRLFLIHTKRLSVLLRVLMARSIEYCALAFGRNN